MNTQSTLELTMIIFVLVSGYLFLLQMALNNMEQTNAKPLVALILLILYVVVAVPFILIVKQLGSYGFVLMAMLMFMSILCLFAGLVSFVRYFDEINKGMLVLFLVFMIVVGYFTIMSRDGTNDTSIFMIQFDAITQAFDQRSLEPLNHMMLNTAMFMPMGFLFPFIDPDRLKKLSYALIIGILSTTLIETVQLVFRLGQADLTDVVTNVIGSAIGYFIFRIYWFFHRDDDDLDFEDDDEE